MRRKSSHMKVPEKEAGGPGNCKKADQRIQVIRNEFKGEGGARSLGFCKYGWNV